MWKKIRAKEAVSEVISIVLLLGITITLFAFLNYTIFSFSFGTPPPSVNLIGTMDKVDNSIIIKHYSGDSLDGTTHVVITVGSSSYQKNVSEMHDTDWKFFDTNHDTKWNFGEAVQFHSPQLITDKYIQVTVVDPATNTIILTTVLQQGT